MQNAECVLESSYLPPKRRQTKNRVCVCVMQVLVKRRRTDDILHNSEIKHAQCNTSRDRRWKSLQYVHLETSTAQELERADRSDKFENFRRTTAKQSFGVLEHEKIDVVQTKAQDTEERRFIKA